MSDPAACIVVVGRDGAEADRLVALLLGLGVPAGVIERLAAGEPPPNPLPSLDQCAVLVAGDVLASAIGGMIPDEPGPEALLEALVGGTRTTEQLQMLESAVDHARDAVVIVSAQGPTIAWANRRFGEMLGRPPESILGQPLETACDGCALADPRVRRAIGAGRAFDGEIDLRTDDRAWIAEVHVAPVYDPHGALTHFVVLQRDVTEKRQAEMQLQHLAHHDQLTGLANRKLFRERLEQAMQRTSPHRERVGVLFLDLDRFKDINDRHGHQVGDSVLRQVGERLAGVVRAGDTLARLGGDEFTAVLPSLRVFDDALVVAEKLSDALNEPISVEGTSFRIGASVGLAVYPDHGRDAETLLRHADDAMYAAKAAGRGRCRVWTPDLS